MRPLLTAFFLLALPFATAEAAPIDTSAQAAADVLSDGYSRVALSERSPGGWDVWATKDGLAYEVKIDAKTGVVVKSKLLDTDD